MDEKRLSTYFLLYQIDWLRDQHLIKFWDKSRRIGASYVQAYEDVRDRVKKLVPDVWFSSADDTAAKEYILYAKKWVKLFNAAAEYLGAVIIDSEDDITAYVIRFSDGGRIIALSSNPNAFRSKGGKVILDEFGHHKQQDLMWAAAEPVTTWGYPLRILSSRGPDENDIFVNFIKDIEDGKVDKNVWSLHRTTLAQAVEQGLLDKIKGQPTTPEEREAWLKEKRQRARREDIWLREYCCTSTSSDSQWLSRELIMAATDPRIEMCPAWLQQLLFKAQEAHRYFLKFKKDPEWWAETAKNLTAPLAGRRGMGLGFDVARVTDKSTLWLLEELNIFSRTAGVLRMEKQPFRVQRYVLYALLPRVIASGGRICIDQNGIGRQLAEEAQDSFGSRVEGIDFTNTNKDILATDTKDEFQNRAVLIPDEPTIHDSLYSVKKGTTATGMPRFDAKRTEELGHADDFWALALALQAQKKIISGSVTIASRGKREATSLLKGY